MKIYTYDYEGKLLGEMEPDICQVTELRKKEQNARELAKGEEKIESLFILPAYSTNKAPPSKLEKGFEWKFLKGDWYASEILKVEVKKELELSYKDKRSTEYPSQYDYLDGVVKSHSKDQLVHEEGVAQIEKYVADCLAVKAKYPKPK